MMSSGERWVGGAGGIGQGPGEVALESGMLGARDRAPANVVVKVCSSMLASAWRLGPVSAGRVETRFRGR